MALSAEEAYKELIERWKEANLLGSIYSVLHWDEQTQMPKGGTEHRAEQVSYLSGVVHKKATDPRVGELLDTLENSDYVKKEESDEASNIREIRREYDLSVKVPQKLVEELSRTRTIAQRNWAEARAKNDFAKFLPHLEKVIKLKLEQAEHLGYEKEPYDALLNQYEPGASAEWIEGVFAAFKDELVDLVKGIADSDKNPNMDILTQDFPVERQKLFCQEAAAAIGYSFHDGRLDISAHPFTTGLGPHDTRITTRYNVNHFGQAFFGTLHEAGHGIYDQNLDPDHYGTPRGESVSLGIHESQSRMWENLVGRSEPFWRHFFPRAQQMYPETLGDVEFDDFYFAINDVRPSFIRVEADEVTYNLHILLRFELERAFTRGDLQAKDIPEAWTEKFSKYLGITPPNDKEGCLQDVHWSMGLIGYFPTYTLGNLYASQFFMTAKDEINYLEDQFKAGHFLELKNWLVNKIHKHGQRYRAGKLVQVVTGKELSHEPAMEHLKGKYGQLYGLK